MTLNGSPLCWGIKDIIYDFIDLTITNFTDATALRYIENVRASVTFNTIIKNIASPGNNVIGVTGNAANFKFEAVLSDSDLSVGGTNEIQVTPLTVLPFTVAQQRLDAQTTLAITVTGTVDISQAECPDVLYICIRLLEGANASFKDLQKSNNIVCVNIEKVKVCSSGMCQSYCETRKLSNIKVDMCHVL